jgi:hypothetical protein
MIKVFWTAKGKPTIYEKTFAWWIAAAGKDNVDLGPCLYFLSGPMQNGYRYVINAGKIVGWLR